MDLKDMNAASGLVKRGNAFYVIADDQLSLAIFSLEKNKSCRFVKLLPGLLPRDHKERKKLKPDWESLVFLSTREDELLILPSGSTLNRCMGVFVELHDEELRSLKKIDLSALYQQLKQNFSELNIEGAVVVGSVLRIFQRGNGPSGWNAIIDLDLNGLTKDIQNLGFVTTERILNITDYDLGTLQGVALSFTDACFCVGDYLFFLAVAESSPSTYDDGEYLGAILGCIDKSGKIISHKELICPFKPEGLWVERIADQYKIYVVTDADDPNQVSSLYVGEFLA